MPGPSNEFAVMEDSGYSSLKILPILKMVP